MQKKVNTEQSVTRREGWQPLRVVAHVKIGQSLINIVSGTLSTTRKVCDRLQPFASVSMTSNFGCFASGVHKTSRWTSFFFQEDLRVMFPCLHAVNPHMREEPIRLQTFDERWPSNRVRATAQQIAKAGFYFLGERDRVKCWYCNGGLQNWEPLDEPWREHAKWFPTYVLNNTFTMVFSCS